MDQLQTETITEEKRQEEQRDEGHRLQQARSPVLIVEDDPANRELLIELLSLWGYDPVAVGSAEEAEWAIRRKAIDAAVIDVFLPGKNGQTLITRLRERFPDATLIGMSALGDAAMARKMKGVGADFFITKPVISEELAEVLKSPHSTWH
jgi:CheY-like chemotaxis protein